MSHTPLPPGGPGPVDRKCGIDPGGPRPVLHAAEDPWRPDLESHHPAGFPLHLREQEDGHHREGEWSPPLPLCLPLPLGVLPLPLSVLLCPSASSPALKSMHQASLHLAGASLLSLRLVSECDSE